MRKFGVFSSTLFYSIILAGIYGILHDQVTSSISPEYFTKFKFIQFKVAPALPFRMAVAMVGFYATWWTGIVIGPILGMIGFLFPDHKTMQRYIRKSFRIVCCIAIVTAFAGFLIGKFYLVHHPPHWYYPEGLIDKNNFVIVGSIHNASYIGGLLGLITASIYLSAKGIKNSRTLSSNRGYNRNHPIR
jgi:hypothetical protein